RRGRAGRRARAALEHTAAAVGDGPAARPALDRRAGGRRRRVADAGAEVEQHVEQDLLLVGQVPAAVFGVIPVRGLADADVEAAVRNASAGRVLGRPVRRVERELLGAPVAPGAVLTVAVHELFRVASERGDLAARLVDVEGEVRPGRHALVHHPVAEVLDARARVRAPERDDAGANVGARHGARVERRGGADARRERIVLVVCGAAVRVDPHEVEVAGEEAPAAVHVLADVRFPGTRVKILVPAIPLTVRDDDIVQREAIQAAPKVTVPRGLVVVAGATAASVEVDARRVRAVVSWIAELGVRDTDLLEHALHGVELTGRDRDARKVGGEAVAHAARQPSGVLVRGRGQLRRLARCLRGEREPGCAAELAHLDDEQELLPDGDVALDDVVAGRVGRGAGEDGTEILLVTPIAARSARGNPRLDGREIREVVRAQDVDERVRNADLIVGVVVVATGRDHAAREARGLVLAAARDRPAQLARAPAGRHLADRRAVDAADAGLERTASPPLFRAVEHVAAVVD